MKAIQAVMNPYLRSVTRFATSSNTSQQMGSDINEKRAIWACSALLINPRVLKTPWGNGYSRSPEAMWRAAKDVRSQHQGGPGGHLPVLVMCRLPPDAQGNHDTDGRRFAVYYKLWEVIQKLLFIHNMFNDSYSNQG